ncbi:MAG: rod shape-determining protein MreD [Flavobacteriales bacterium]|nr:rod shape-determining protein MreD [Flavobacteriales bacterium]
MLNNILLKNILSLFFIATLQVLVFNQLSFYEGCYPMIYMLWVYYYPIKSSKNLFLFLGFVLGLIMDLFADTGGVHAFATVFVVFIRNSIIRKIHSNQFDFSESETTQDSFSFLESFLIIFILVSVHVSLIFFMDNFKLGNIVHQLSQVLYTVLFSVVSIYVVKILFYSK